MSVLSCNGYDGHPVSMHRFCMEQSYPKQGNQRIQRNSKTYRKPQIWQVIVRSVLDRSIFVLGRAVSVAAPAGLIIWLMANIDVNGVSLLSHCAEFLDPFASLLGLDGVIMMGFIFYHLLV